MVQMYKIFNVIDIVKKKVNYLPNSPTLQLEAFSQDTKKSSLKIRCNYFSNRIVQTWNDLPECVKMARSLIISKSRLNSSWHEYPYKFTLWCYTPGGRTSIVNTHLDASIDVEKPNQTLTV